MVDADDRLAPGALDAMRAPLDADPRLGFAYGTMRFFGAWEGELRFPDYDAYRLLYRHTIGLSALMRREVIDDTGGFDPAFETYEDWELWLNALAHGWRGRRVDAVTLEYRRHAAASKLGRGPPALPPPLRRPAAQARGALRPRRRAGARGPRGAAPARGVSLVLGRAAGSRAAGGLRAPAPLRAERLTRALSSARLRSRSGATCCALGR